MRLHRLTVRAFGPFPGVEHIDFDELSSAGLFLLTGPTGAGKTTILDAICFALYGSVPGVRGVKALKSQHAAPDAQPEVVLDFSVRDRRFVIRRSPEWTRPKRRGDGTITEKASATLTETTGGVDHFLSSRAQEVGHTVSELIGMQSTQFAQVAMLPQGEFQRFLRASSQDRHDVLQHLFRSERFARIEDWVHDHSRGLREKSADAELAVQRILDTAADHCSVELPEDVLASAAEWMHGRVTVAQAQRAEASARHAVATERAALARDHHGETRRLLALTAKRDQASAALATLAAREDEVDEARRRLELDQRAARCLPLVRMLDETDVALSRTRRERDEALRSAGLSGSVTPAELELLEQQERARITRLEGLLPREDALMRAKVELEQGQASLDTMRAEHQMVVERRDGLPELIAAAEARVTESTVAASRREVLEAETTRARTRVEAADALVACARALALDGDRLRDARDRHADARERVQDLTARRLAGIAAELAGRLVEGTPCQVCGSVEHPAPTAPRADAVTEAEQDVAAAQLEAARARHDEATAALATSQRRHDLLVQTADGLSPADAAAALEAVRADLLAARAAEAARVEADRVRAGLVEELTGLTGEAHELATSLAALEQRLHGHRATIQDLTAEIATELTPAARPEASPATAGPDGEKPMPWASVREGLDTARERLDRVTAARVAVTAHSGAERRRGEVEDQATTTAREHGFDDLAGVRAAALEAHDRVGLESLVTEHAEQTSAARAVLADPEVSAIGDQEPPDLAATEEALRLAEAELAETGRGLHGAERLLDSLDRNETRLRQALDAWGPAREEYLRAESMSKLVRGMGADNQLQMRLSAYVLATRLDQVVAAANERLAHMRDQRYLLQRTGRATRRGAQAGLGLEVVDQWTGDVRDPATLSGGETFVVSLALALGLADVVTHEAGGTEIETLFVDEGFGTLDADTLDDVMDRLDELRAGGRAVGVVSHVSELRNRIPTQLHVDKHRTGSSVAVRTLVG